MIRRSWSESELVAALSLYYQIPFGACDQRNPAVIALASHLERTPSAVALKLVNFASLDPTITSTGRSGMRNASRDDRRVFEEYGSDWDRLCEHLPDSVRLAVGRRREPSSHEPSDHDDLEHSWSPNETEVARTVKARRGQEFFRNAVLAAYRGRCCITSLPVRELLCASHIIPWRIDVTSRLDPTNGLCLAALHDAAFDSGLLTLDDDCRVVYARTLRGEAGSKAWNEWFAPYEATAIELPERLKPRPDALSYHRTTIFVG